MKYNKDYFIMCWEHDSNIKYRIEKVKGSAFPFSFSDYLEEYGRTPDLFIFKCEKGYGYSLSDSKTGLILTIQNRLKDINEWINEPNNIKRVLEAYNKPFILEKIKIFNDLIKAA